MGEFINRTLREENIKEELGNKMQIKNILVFKIEQRTWKKLN
jgi:hypothetical protein